MFVKILINSVSFCLLVAPSIGFIFSTFLHNRKIQKLFIPMEWNMTVSCDSMTSEGLVLRKSHLSPNKITSVGNSVPVFDHLILVAGSHSTVSKHSWLGFSERKFNFTVSIKIYGRISPCCSPISHVPQFSNTFTNAVLTWRIHL